MARTRTWTATAAEVERERTHQVARVGNNLNQILDVDIEQARRTLAELHRTTWRVELREIDGERFVVLPAGSLERPPWTVGGQPAVKLSSE